MRHFCSACSSVRLSVVKWFCLAKERTNVLPRHLLRLMRGPPASAPYSNTKANTSYHCNFQHTRVPDPIWDKGSGLDALAPIVFRRRDARGVRRLWLASLASPLLLRRQSSDLWFSLCQSKTGVRNKVKRQRRFGTEVEAASRAAAQIKTLIDSLSRCQQLLDCDIETEEERTGCSDYRDPAHSVFARSLIQRRDNVAATIAILQERLSKTELLTSAGIGSAPEQLLPA